MKKNKLELKTYVGLGLVIALVLMIGLTVKVNAELSVIDRLINVAGTKWAEKLPVPEMGELTFGAFPGPDMYQRVNMHAGFQSGGDTYATSSTAAAYTLVAAEFNKDKTYIDWTPNVNTTLTTMASTSMGFMDIKNAGDERSYWFRNASSTPASTITFAAGTGVDIQKGAATGDDLVIDGLDLAKLTFIRKADTDVLLIVNNFMEGD